MRLNLGASATRIPGFVNVDRAPAADLVLDLARDRLPYADGSVDEVFSYHTLEHLSPDGYLHCLEQVWWVLRHGGLLLVGVPYATSTEYNLVNPYHRTLFNEHSWRFFDDLKGSAGEDNPIKFRLVGVRYHWMPGWERVPGPLRTWARRHLVNTVRRMDAALVAIKPPRALVPGDLPTADAVWRRFDEVLGSRVPA